MMNRARQLSWLALLVSAAAVASAAAAADRFVPRDPRFLVADVRKAVPDPELAKLIADWRANPAADELSVALGEALLERAHRLRRPIYVGRAEAVLAGASARMGASYTTWRLYAQTLQYRHDFSSAESLLDKVLLAVPHDAAARVQRASLRLVRGNFSGARADCTQLLASGGSEQAIALACLAQALAASGRLSEAQTLLAAYPLPPERDAAIRAYWLTVRGELHERAKKPDQAIADYGAALALSPENDAIRASLADALLARGERQAANELLAVERPSLALLVRRAACAGAERDSLRAQAAALLELEVSRGDASHRREAALLALDAGDIPRALSEAEANFEIQKELPDVRILARAAVAGRDAGARHRLEQWLRDTGYRDAVTEEILAAAARS